MKLELNENLIIRINLIFNRQTEQLLKDLVYNFCTEEGINTSNIDEAIKNEEPRTSLDPWGCIRYSRLNIKNILFNL